MVGKVQVEVWRRECHVSSRSRCLTHGGCFHLVPVEVDVHTKNTGQTIVDRYCEIRGTLCSLLFAMTSAITSPLVFFLGG
jgi:hypothetical protein